MMSDEQEIEITPTLLQTMKMCKIYKDHQKDINAIDFSKDGQYLVSCDDCALNVFDILSGKKVKTLYNKIREIDLVRFTHHNSSVLCVTKKEPFEIFYWSLHDNQILKKFVGHTNSIHWIDLSPVSDDFLSCSMDGTLRLWNLTSESQTCEGFLDLSTKKTFCVAAFDPSGQVFAVVFLEEYYCVSNNWLYLYDIKKYNAGPFTSKKINCNQVRCIKFSNNNGYILCSTGDGSILILNAYTLDNICELSDFSNEGSMIEAGFTPDNNYVISGSESGTIYIWNIPNGTLLAKLEGHQKRCKVVKFCPQFLLMASGCRNLVLWIPDHFQNDYMNNNNSRRNLMSI